MASLRWSYKTYQIVTKVVLTVDLRCLFGCGLAYQSTYFFTHVGIPEPPLPVYNPNTHPSQCGAVWSKLSTNYSGKWKVVPTRVFITYYSIMISSTLVVLNRIDCFWITTMIFLKTQSQQTCCPFREFDTASSWLFCIGINTSRC